MVKGIFEFHKSRKKFISFDNFFLFIVQVLTSGNVIITEREVPKICGFDMRALLDESNANTKTFQEVRIVELILTVGN